MNDQVPTAGAYWAAVVATCVVLVAFAVLIHRANRRPPE